MSALLSGLRSAVKLSIVLAGLMAAAVSVSASITANFIASRTTGVAPLAVNFDTTAQPDGTAGTTGTATTRPFHDLYYLWDYGDPASGTWGTNGKSKNRDTGPIGGHVYESPGTYTVTLLVKDSTGTTVTKTAMITVQDPNVVFSGANTICVSRTSDFTGAPSGATQTISTSWSTIKGLLASGKRVLLHRGQAWDHDNAQRQLTFAGPGILGAFGTGAAPILDLKTPESSGGGRVFLLGDSSHPNQFGDFRFMDLEVRGNTNDRGFANVNSTVHDVLFLRINMHDAGRFLEFGGSTLTYYNDPNHGSDYHPGQTMYSGIHVVDTQYNHIIGDGAEFNGRFIAFIASVHSIFMGNTWNDSHLGEHVLRVPYAQRLIIAHNRLSNCRDKKHVIKLHAAHDDPSFTGVDPTDPWGFNSKYITIVDNYIANNQSDWYIAVGPQNSTEDELVSDVILERNEVVQLAGTTGWEAFDIRADEVTIRNNAFIMTGTSGGTAIYLGWRGGEPFHQNIRVYNNSAFQGSTGGFTFLNVASSVSGTIAKNNLAKSTGSSPLMITGSGTVTQSNNSLTPTPGWVSSAPTTAFGFDLLSTSAAINAGTTVPVFDDYDEAPRPQSTTWDLGAFEYITATPIVSITANIPSASEPSTNGQFTVNASPAPTSPITVNLSIGGTATNGTDYATIPNTVTIGTGGSATINVTVTDDATVESAETVTLTVLSGTGYTVGSPTSATVTIADNDTANSVPSITTASLPGGTAGTAYSQTLTAAGGDGALVWSLASGSLPAGLSLSSAGVISGTPTFAANASFAIKVADSDGITGPSDEDVETFTLTIAPASGATKLSVGGGAVTASSDDGNVPANTVDNNLATRWSAQGDGQWIQYDLGAASTISYVKIAWYSGDIRIATFDVQTANASTGPWTNALTNQQSTGTTTALETYDFADVSARYVRIVGHGNTDNSWTSITETEVWGTFVNSVPNVTTTTLPNGTAAASYSQTLAATGGNGTLAWTLDSGALPAGLSLSSAGVISGTPTFGGTSVFTVRVADSDGVTGGTDEDTQALTLIVNPVSGATKFAVPGTSVTASADDGNVPANTVDGSLTTRWSAQGDGQWIQYDLGASRTINYVKIAWYQGDTRTSTLDVQTASASTGPWTNVITGKVSSGTTGGLEVYDFTDTTARYVRIVGHGNSTGNGWNSIAETEVWGVGLPSPWVEADIGAVGAAGSSSYSSGTFSIDGSGVGIGNSADEFHFVYQAASGDCSITAKVLSVENTNPSAKAGVMIRETLGDTSKHASVIINPSSNAVFVRRTSTGGTTSTTTQGAGIPYWVRVTRVGDTFTAARSSDGSTWTTIQSQTITMGTTVYIGLAVTSTSDGTLCTSTMSNVTASP